MSVVPRRFPCQTNTGHVQRPELSTSGRETETAMPIISENRPYVIGVDTHAKKHVLVILDTRTGAKLAHNDFPTTAAGLRRTITWAARRTDGDLASLWVIEGACSYGALLAAAVTEAGYQVAEAARMPSPSKRAQGKNDLLDAHAIAHTVLALDEDALRRPRQAGGARAALQVKLAARNRMSKQHTRNVNALTALVRLHDLGIDARKALSHAQIQAIAAWREHSRDDLAQAAAREEARFLAKEILEIDVRVVANDKALAALVEASPARGLLPMTGIGPFTAAQCYVSWSHEGRIDSEASFAALAGASPIPASSGNTQRYRLSRFGDRQLNRALHQIAISRAKNDPETAAYMARRTNEGKSKREARRCLKRYLARKIYRVLNTAAKTLPNPQPTTA